MGKPRRKRAASDGPLLGESGLTPPQPNCLAKERGYILAVDQATNTAGVTLWKNGRVQAGAVISSLGKSIPFSKRMQNQLVQLNEFMDEHLPFDKELSNIIFEGVRSRLVLVVVGAFCTCPTITVDVSAKKNFVETPSWKSWARKHGALEPVFGKIKGVKALTETGFFSTTNFRTDSDDVADSILIYLTWRDREK